MTIMLDLSPEEEARLQRKAARQGQDVTTFLRTVIARETQAASPEEVEARVGCLQKWAASHKPGEPLLTDEEISREALYEGGS